jgi:hypothetical protein
VSIIIYNLHGQKVKILQDNTMDAGLHTLPFDASYFASGIYFCKMTAQSLLGTQLFIDTKKMMLVK